MTSKEVIERLKEFANHFATNGYPYNQYSSSSIQIKSELEIIEKELDEFLEYKKLEEKVGLNLFIINKALTEGLWFKYDSSKPIIYVEPCDVNPTKGSYLRIFNSTILEFKDYGKTWALTKEELEND